MLRHCLVRKQRKNQRRILGLFPSLFVCFEDCLQVGFVEDDFEMLEYVGSAEEPWDFV